MRHERKRRLPETLPSAGHAVLPSGAQVRGSLSGSAPCKTTSRTIYCFVDMSNIPSRVLWTEHVLIPDDNSRKNMVATPPCAVLVRHLV